MSTALGWNKWPGRDVITKSARKMTAEQWRLGGNRLSAEETE